MKNFIRNTIQSQKIFYRYFRKKGFKRFLKENILEVDGSNEVKAKSIALGVFVGITPLWGFHTVAILFLASVFKLNKFLSYIGSQVSFPLLIPFIVFLSMIIGAPFVSGTTHFENQTLDMDFIKNNLIQYIIGSLILATISSLALGFLSYLILQQFSPKQK